MMIQKRFAEGVVEIIRSDSLVIGLAAGGSWVTNEIDEFSDLDLILVTREKISGDKSRMLDYAKQFGKLVTGFTGEHVREPRLLICLYDDPLLHVDIKFLTLSELDSRIETPVVLWDTNGQLQEAISQTTAQFPFPDFQWMEDRFWVWIHYTLSKIGRGEYFEALDCLGYLRAVVLGPFLHIKYGYLPKGVRKLEIQIDQKDLIKLKSTLAECNKQSLLAAVQHGVELYLHLREKLFKPSIILQKSAEQKVIEYFQLMKKEG